ncbi:MAG: BACON domain-containing protein, partial [Sediminibacterium sp.]|nr:BACON domain-containing protein [Sediminibacterium sp.]
MKNIFIIIGLFLGILAGNSQTRYTINTTTSAGGRIATTLQVDSGTNYRLTYKADSNYRIDSIIINDTLNAKDSLNGYTFRNVGSNQKIRLVFKRVYFIAILKNRGLLLKDTLKADSGKNFRVNFTADSGFRIDSIFVNANRISLDSINGYSFSNVTSNYSIRLSLRKIFVILTTTNAGGIIEDTLRIDSAQNAQVLFYPDSGYFLDTLVINKTTMVYDSINSYTFYNVQSNQKAAAMFSPFCASIDSSILSYDSSAHLDSFLVTAPNCRWQAVANVPWISIRNVKNTGTGYVKFSIQANTDTLNRVGIITVGDKQRVVEQRYLPLTYYLNVYEQYNQLLILKNTIEVQENSNKLFKINTTPTNFAFVEIVLDSTIIHDTSLLLSRINANHKIVFKYQYISNNSFTTIQNGIISPINLDVDRGANVRFSYVPDSGYEFDYVIANGEVNYDSPTNFTLYNIDTNSHLDVFFKPIYRTITVNKTYKTNNKITYQEKFIYPENAQFANANYIFIDTVNNVKITFPIDSQNQNIQVAVTKVNNIDTMLPFYGGNSYKRVGAVYSIDLLNIDTSGIFKLVTIPYNPNLVSDPQNIEAAYYNDSLGKWLSAGVVSIDTIYHNISLYTNHFSRWTIYSNEKITTDFPDFDTGFRPDKDGFYFPNDLPVPYNDPKGRNGESANGNCFGFSAISLLYYIFKDLNAINLYNLSFNGPPII